MPRAVYLKCPPARWSTSKLAGVAGGVFNGRLILKRACSWAAMAAVLQQDSQLWFVPSTTGGPDTSSGSDQIHFLAHGWMVLAFALGCSRHLATATAEHDVTRELRAEQVERAMCACAGGSTSPADGT